MFVHQDNGNCLILDIIVCLDAVDLMEALVGAVYVSGRRRLRSCV
jgi:hypothetical protein